MKRRLLILLLIQGAFTSISQAAMFEDDFDSYQPALNWSGAGVWAVTDGTVDLIGDGTPWDWLPGNGYYIDLDGNGDPGILSISVDLAAGGYTLEFDLAGSNHPSSIHQSDETVHIEIGSILTDDITLAYNEPFDTKSYSFSLAAPETIKISFENTTLNTPRVGALLDNVRVIPIPGAALLGVLGLGSAGSLLRRRKMV